MDADKKLFHVYGEGRTSEFNDEIFVCANCAWKALRKYQEIIQTTNHTSAPKVIVKTICEHRDIYSVE